MQIRLLFVFALCLTGVLLLSSRSAAHAAPQPLSESDKIEALLRTIDGLQDVVFIRNGREHDCHAAARHLRTKWNARHDVIKTARDFVLLLASRSSLSGKPYLMRWKSGQLQTSESFLLMALKKIEEAQARQSSGARPGRAARRIFRS